MKALRIASGFLVGLLVGAGAVLLFAPRSGSDTQGAIRQWFEQVLSEGLQAAETRRLELTAQFEALKQPQPQV